jgi:hypothetical protein
VERKIVATNVKASRGCHRMEASGHGSVHAESGCTAVYASCDYGALAGDEGVCK